MKALDDLIARLEAATDGSRELDAEIAIEVWPLASQYHAGARRSPDAYSVPKYTTSLDAALSLVPEGWRWQIRQDPHRYCGIVHDERPLSNGNGRGFHKAFAPTPAFALAIPALKARRES